MRQTTLLLLLGSFVLWGCSVQKKTTQSGWHVESAWFNSGPTSHIQSQAKPATTPLSLRRAGTLASTNPHRPDLRLPNRSDGQPNQQLAPSVALLHSGTVAAMTTKKSRLQRRLLQDIHIQPSYPQHHPLQSHSKGQEGDPNAWIHIGIGLALLGLFLLPSPAALLGIGLSTFAFMVGILLGPKNVPAASPNAKSKRRRPWLKMLLLLVVMTLTVILMAVSIFTAATSGWSNPFEGWTMISW